MSSSNARKQRKQRREARFLQEVPISGRQENTVGLTPNLNNNTEGFASHVASDTNMEHLPKSNVSMDQNLSSNPGPIIPISESDFRNPEPEPHSDPSTLNSCSAEPSATDKYHVPNAAPDPSTIYTADASATHTHNAEPNTMSSEPHAEYYAPCPTNNAEPCAIITAPPNAVEDNATPNEINQNSDSESIRAKVNSMSTLNVNTNLENTKSVQQNSWHPLPPPTVQNEHQWQNNYVNPNNNWRQFNGNHDHTAEARQKPGYPRSNKHQAGHFKGNNKSNYKNQNHKYNPGHNNNNAIKPTMGQNSLNKPFHGQNGFNKSHRQNYPNWSNEGSTYNNPTNWSNPGQTFSERLNQGQGNIGLPNHGQSKFNMPNQWQHSNGQNQGHLNVYRQHQGPANYYQNTGQADAVKAVRERLSISPDQGHAESNDLSPTETNSIKSDSPVLDQKGNSTSLDSRQANPVVHNVGKTINSSTNSSRTSSTSSNSRPSSASPKSTSSNPGQTTKHNSGKANSKPTWKDNKKNKKVNQGLYPNSYKTQRNYDYNSKYYKGNPNGNKANPGYPVSSNLVPGPINSGVYLNSAHPNLPIAGHPNLYYGNMNNTMPMPPPGAQYCVPKINGVKPNSPTRSHPTTLMTVPSAGYNHMNNGHPDLSTMNPHSGANPHPAHPVTIANPHNPMRRTSPELPNTAVPPPMLTNPGVPNTIPPPARTSPDIIPNTAIPPPMITNPAVSNTAIPPPPARISPGVPNTTIPPPPLSTSPGFPNTAIPPPPLSTSPGFPNTTIPPPPLSTSPVLPITAFPPPIHTGSMNTTPIQSMNPSPELAISMVQPTHTSPEQGMYQSNAGPVQRIPMNNAPMHIGPEDPNAFSTTIPPVHTNTGNAAVSTIPSAMYRNDMTATAAIPSREHALIATQAHQNPIHAPRGQHAFSAPPPPLSPNSTGTMPLNHRSNSAPPPNNKALQQNVWEKAVALINQRVQLALHHDAIRQNQLTNNNVGSVNKGLHNQMMMQQPMEAVNGNPMVPYNYMVPTPTPSQTPPLPPHIAGNGLWYPPQPQQQQQPNINGVPLQLGGNGNMVWQPSPHVGLQMPAAHQMQSHPYYMQPAMLPGSELLPAAVGANGPTQMSFDSYNNYHPYPHHVHAPSLPYIPETPIPAWTNLLPGESVPTEASTGVPFVTMTSDRPAGQPLVAPSSSNNLNPTAPVFCRGGQDKGPQSSFSADVSEKELSKEFNKELNLGQPLTNGDVHTSGAGNYFGNSPRPWVNQPFQPRMHTQVGTPQGGQAVPGAMNMGHAPMAVGQANQANGHQSYSNANSMGLPAEAAANTSRQNADGAGGEPSEGQGSSSAGPGAVVNGDADSGGAGNGSAEAEVPAEEELQYPDELIAPIRKQLEYYFSPENLPHDKYLNTHMDINKYVPLKLFPDFNRMKPICSGIDQLVQAVHTSGLLELNDDRTRVRISQTRKTLTLRGLPPKAVEEDIHKLLRDNDCPPAQHIEIISIHTVSNWYASFPTEDLCMEAFFKLHNNQITVDGYPLGCCIKSSGTHVATGYFPPQEEHRERRIPQSQAPNVAATVQGSITQQPALQQPPALMQQYNHVQLHPGLMASAHQSLYFGQNPQYLNMQYMPGMITQSWPGTAGLDPGLVSIDAICMAYRQRRALVQQMLQSSGLQPQHIRTPTMPRPMVQGQASHRFQRPQRMNNRQNMDRNNVPQVSVSGTSSRNNPATGLDGHHGQMPGSIVAHAPSHITRRTANLREEIASTQHAAAAGQYITPIVTQHQVTGVPSTTAIVNNPSSVLEGAGISNTAPSLPHNAVNVAAHPTMPQAVQQSQSHSHPPSVLIQQTAMAGGVGNTPTSNPLPQPIHQHHHHQPHHHHHHHQPPPPPPQIPHPLQQQQPPQPTQQHNHPHHHHQQHQQSHHHHPHHHSHHHSIGNNSHHQGQQQHIGGHHQQQQAPPPSAPHQHQQSLHAQHGHHHHQQHHHSHPPHHHHPHHHQHQQTHHGMVPPQHQHHQPPPGERRSLVMPPQQPPAPQPHHHQQSAPLGNRRNRRRREDTTNRNQRERNLVNRTNFSSQAPAAADNFTMEANSFPPLPGAANAPSSEIAPENRMMHSDIVKGISRVPSIGTAAAPLPARGNSSSTTPSPVATPTLTPSHVPSPSGPAMVVDVQGGDDMDSMVEDDATSSSQEEAEADVSNVEPVSRQGRSDISAAPVPDVAPMPVQSRQIHPSGGSNNRQVHNLAQAKTPQHQHHQPQPTVSLQQQSPSPQSNAPALSPGNAPASSEAPKLSYAQILFAQKKAANNAAAESNANAVAAAPNNVAPPCSTAPGAAASAAATINGPANNQTSVLPASQPNSGNGRMGQANNAFREQGNYPPNPGHRPVSHRLPKDGQTRPDGPQSRLPNGRRNSKENRTQGPPGKFQDRKKPDGRPK